MTTEGMKDLFDDREVERLLRQEWWLHHGCPFSSAYGDDGEMQCHGCACDFKRTPLPDLYRHVMVRRMVNVDA